MAVWIDETGTLVQPAHPATIELSELRTKPIPDGLPDRFRRMFAAAREIPSDAAGYRAAILDWVRLGADSPHALKPDEVVAASQPRSKEQAEAAASFELGEYLRRRHGFDAAVPWWRRAHELDPANWAYKRQAWTLANTQPGQPSDLMQAPTEHFAGNWLDDIEAIGPDQYYAGVKAPGAGS
jgi:hypothetical protein